MNYLHELDRMDEEEYDRKEVARRKQIADKKSRKQYEEALLDTTFRTNRR